MRKYHISNYHSGIRATTLADKNNYLFVLILISETKINIFKNGFHNIRGNFIGHQMHTKVFELNVKFTVLCDVEQNHPKNQNNKLSNLTC